MLGVLSGSCSAIAAEKTPSMHHRLLLTGPAWRCRLLLLKAALHLQKEFYTVSIAHIWRQKEEHTAAELACVPAAFSALLPAYHLDSND